MATEEYEFKITTSREGLFFDMFLKAPFPPFFITSYGLLDKEIIVCEDDSKLKLGKKKKRKKLTNIEELRNALNMFIKATIDILAPYFSNVSPTDISIELLEDQLIFDLLFDKYLNEKKMTVRGYAKYLCKFLDGFSIDGKEFTVDGVYKGLKRAMEENYTSITYHQELKNQAEAMGFSSKVFDGYFTNKSRENVDNKKPKYLWSIFFYNRNLITYKQYRRELTKESRNYPYADFIKDLKNYNKFTEKLLPPENDNPKQYFSRIMDYYILESYKRLDFDFKLITTMEKTGIAEIDKKHWLVKRFHPEVATPFEEDDKLQYGKVIRYYRPLFMIEDKIQKQMQDEEELTDKLSSAYSAQLLYYQMIRAKAYEIFKYHCEFIPTYPQKHGISKTYTNYIEIKNFIREHYDLCAYHETNTIWKTIEDTKWDTAKPEKQRKLKKILKSLIKVNNSLFWESPERKNNPTKNQ